MIFSRMIALPSLGLAGALLMTTAFAQDTATVAPVAEAAPAPAAELTDQQPASHGDAAAGQTKAAACGACHGLDGNSANPLYPKLAGQHERYIARQLDLFKNMQRNNPIMLGMAATLSPQDMRDIGAYFATQKVIPGVADDSKLTDGPMADHPFYALGEKIFRSGKADGSVPACMACHGPTGAGNPGAAWPALAGQHASYTSARLTAFRGGEAWGKDAKASNIMATVAAGLSDQEIQALATYIEGLHSVADQPVAAAGNAAQ